MQSLNKKLRNKTFFSEFEKPITEEGHIYYKIASKIFERNSLSDQIISVSPLLGSKNYDAFKIEGKKNDFILKISLDENDPLLKNECLFYKNNQDECLCKLVDHGVFKVGDNIMFLLLKDDLGYDLQEIGKSFALSNTESLCYSILNQSRFISVNTFADYIDEIKNLNSLDKISEYTLLSIKQYQDIDSLKFLIKEINECLEVCKNKKSSKLFDFCHGNLNEESITNLNGFYKFCNFDDCFYGNQFIDIGILCFNLGYKELDFNFIARSYCKAAGFDFDLKKEEARESLDSAFYIFLSRLIFDFIIEQCVYKNSREEIIISLVQRFENSSWFLKKSKLSTGFRSSVKSMFKEPVDFDIDLRAKYGE